MKKLVLAGVLSAVSLTFLTGFMAPPTACPACYGYRGWQPPMMAYYPMQYQMPWWSMYGQMAYPQTYNRPGPWMNNGIYQHAYPGSGDFFAAKPNLYVTGAAGQDVSVGVTLERDASWLVAIPSYGDKGWSGKLAKDAAIRVGQTDYGYFFYDYRFHGKTLQDKRGFCADEKEVVAKMASALHLSGFTQREIADFHDHWKHKMPPSKKFCVFPQENEILDQVARLDISPAPALVKRILFMVTVEENLNGSGAKFALAPVERWKPVRAERAIASQKDGIEVREWGVGFIASPQAESKSN